MRTSRPANRFRSFYGAGPVNSAVVLAGLALFGYVLSVVGVATLWNPATWWQSIAVWFLGSVLLHDVVLFPIYAAADGLLRLPFVRARSSRAPSVNYIRLPLMASALTFVLFLPGIVGQGGPSFHAATGLDQSPYLLRWILLVAGFHVCSLAVYCASLLHRSHSDN